MSAPHPHGQARIVLAGEPLSNARAALILLHGRGSSAEDILSLMPHFDMPGFAYFAPQAADYTWYPNSFLAPLASNEPRLASALRRVDETVQQARDAGIPQHRIMVLGFSQGACLALEYAARHARRYGGLAGLSGGLIGPEGTPRDYPGSLEGTPVFLGCSDVDIHIPQERVIHSAAVLRTLGGEVTTRLYPGMGHTVNQDELDFVRGMLVALAGAEQ